MIGVRDEAIVTRSDAMRVPAIAKARGLIVGHLARLPLTAWTLGQGEPPVDVQLLPTPTWLISTFSRQSPRTRMAWTVDDLIFGGLALWAVERDSDGRITDAVRVDPAYWSIDPDSLGVLVNGEAVSDEQVILFEGYQEGLLTIGAAEIRGALDMSMAWRQRVASPIPLVELHETDPNIELEPDEIDELLTDWEAARRAGGTAFTPSHIQAITHGDVIADLMVEGRNASRLDFANILQVPANLLEGSLSTASLTYSTQEGRQSDFVTMCLAYWASPIEARLSADDVTPDSTVTRFDLTGLIRANALPQLAPSSED